MSRAKKLMPLLRMFITDPAGVVRALPGEVRQKHGSEQYDESDVSQGWFEQLHSLLGAPCPCPESAELDHLLIDIAGRLSEKGLGTGRHTYGWYSDAEHSLSSAIWCAVRHIQPDTVIETGVAHGVSSRVVLEALERNSRGLLVSIDLPHPLDHRLHLQTAVAVTDSCRDRWTYVEGSSRSRLPSVIAGIDEVQVFIHDSLHTARNTLFEMEQAATKMTVGGVMLIDDIKAHDGFARFAENHPEYQTIVCPTPDRIGMFGIAVNIAPG